ncbi:unnamed protein product [Agarophyton chilense]|eukprot:gb/GEZJ01000435.1/.p1 GENE.gb/GEZJ01000435.1/~~gb/GEZJ01000435.1/.p1  ORF type:complete len:735 (-),score=131.15 gb/GEZJ01000435.1/:967-3171(-)
MGKKRPVFEFKGLSGILGDSSSSTTKASNYTRSSPRTKRHRHRHHKSRRHYSRRKHFASDQRYRRRKAQQLIDEDAEQLAERMRRDDDHRNSLRDSVIAASAPHSTRYSAQHISHTAQYFQRTRAQAAPAGYAYDGQMHETEQHHTNGSPAPYSPPPPPPPPPPPGAPGVQPPNPTGSERSRPHHSRARRPHLGHSRHSEQQHTENEASREESADHHEENSGQSEDEGDDGDLLGGGRGLFRKFANSKMLNAATKNKPRRKRKILAAAGALAGAAALAFAGKKFLDGRKEQRKEDEDQEEDDAANEHGASGPFDSEGIYMGPNPLNLVPPPTKFSVKVPQNEAFIIERGGRFHRRLNAGSNTLIPCVDHISFRYSLKESSMPIAWQQCFTRDNVPIRVNALLFIRVDDPISASYEIDNAYHAIIMLVQSSIKREFNKLTVEQAYTERYHLDQAIKEIINTASRAWGVRCTRFEIRQVELPEDLRMSLENAAAEERKRREEVRQAEAQCEIMVNRAEAEMQLQMRRSQARQVDMVNQAIGEAHAISERSEAIANAMRDLAEAVSGPDGEKAMQMRIAEQYLQAYGQIASGGPNPPPGPDPRQVASTVNDAIGLLNTLGQPHGTGHNPYIIPETNPFENAPGIHPQETSSMMNGAMMPGAPDVPTTLVHEQPLQCTPSGVLTPDMSQTTSQHGVWTSTPAAQGGTAYPQPKKGKKGGLKLNAAQLLKGAAKLKSGL